MRGRFLALVLALGVATILAQRTGAPGTRATVTLTYRAASEDEAGSGQVALAIQPDRTSRATIWERSCALGSWGDGEAPDQNVDQYWTFSGEIDNRPTGGQPSVRLRYRHGTEQGPEPEVERVLLADGKDALHLEGLSARTTCRYDRIYITAVAR